MRKIFCSLAGLGVMVGLLIPAPARAYTCYIEGDPNGMICKTIMSIPNPVCRKYGCL